MSGQVHVVALITPAPGKEARMKELLTNLAIEVKQREKDVSKYQLYEQQGVQNGTVFVVEEIYENQEAHDAHFKTEQFTALGQTIQKEGLVAAASDVDIRTIKPIGGFASR